MNARLESIKLLEKKATAYLLVHVHKGEGTEQVVHWTAVIHNNKQYRNNIISTSRVLAYNYIMECYTTTQNNKVNIFILM